MRATSHNIVGMVGINKLSLHHRLPKWLRHVWREVLFDITIKLFPICCDVEGPFIHARVARVHYQSLLGILPQKVEDEIEGFKVSLPWGILILRHDGHLILNVDPSKFDSPPQDANELLVPLHVIGITLIRLIQLRLVAMRQWPLVRALA